MNLKIMRFFLSHNFTEVKVEDMRELSVEWVRYDGVDEFSGDRFNGCGRRNRSKESNELDLRGFTDEVGLERARAVVPFKTFTVTIPQFKAVLLFAVLVAEVILFCRQREKNNSLEAAPSGSK